MWHALPCQTKRSGPRLVGLPTKLLLPQALSAWRWFHQAGWLSVAATSCGCSASCCARRSSHGGRGQVSPGESTSAHRGAAWQALKQQLRIGLSCLLLVRTLAARSFSTAISALLGAPCLQVWLCLRCSTRSTCCGWPSLWQWHVAAISSCESRVSSCEAQEGRCRPLHGPPASSHSIQAWQ